MNRKEKDVRINEILDAVIECKKNSAIEYIQASQVAARAGISTRTLNRYFPDYDRMLFDASTRYLQTRFQDIMDAYEKMDLDSLNGRERLIAFMNMQIERYSSNLMDTILYIEANIRYISIGMDKKCKKNNFGSEIGQIIVDNITLGINDGSIRNGLDPLKTALMFSSNFNGLMQRLMFIYRTNYPGFSTDDVFELMREYVTMMDIYLKS